MNNKAFYDNEREIDLDEQKRLYRREKKVIFARTAVFIASIFGIAWSADGNHYGYIGAAILIMIFFSLPKFPLYVNGYPRQGYPLSRVSCNFPKVNAGFLSYLTVAITVKKPYTIL